MNEGYTIQLSGEALAVLPKLRDDAGVAFAVARAMDRENQFTVSHIQQAYLSFPKSGPAVPIGLRVQTNRLRSSMRATKALVTPQEVLSSIGSNVKYAAPHEFGFEGDVTVRPHTRKKIANETIFGERKNVRKADIGVRSYTRHMSLPARGFTQRGIQDRAPSYGAAVSLAILDYWRSKS